MKDLADVFHAVVEQLERQGIEYAVMGGLVVRIYGIPRPTYDIDVTIAVLDTGYLRSWADKMNIRDRLEGALQDQGHS